MKKNNQKFKDAMRANNKQYKASMSEIRKGEYHGDNNRGSCLIVLIVVFVIVFLFLSWPTRFMIFTFFALVALMIGLTKPVVFKRILKNPTRGKIGLIFGVASLLFFILSGITAPKNPAITFNDFNDTSKEVMAPSFELKGKISPANSSIKIKKDNKTYITTEIPDKDGNFIYKVDLNVGDNNFTFTADNHGKTISVSKKLVRKLSQEEISRKETEAKAKADAETKAKADADATEKARIDKETEYLKQASDISNENGQLLGYSGNFLSQKPNPLFWTEDEKIKLATSMGFIKSNYSRGKELQPPTRFEDAHNIFLESLKKYSDAMDLMAQGIDSLDANKMQKATNLMAEGNTLTQQATAKFLELKQ